MKTKRLILLLILLFLCGCQKYETGKSAAEIGDRVAAATEICFENTGIGADELYLEDLPPLSDFAFYAARDGARGSFMILCLENQKDVARAKESLEVYLAQEREAKAALAALYPSPATSREVEDLQNAVCFTSGRVICCYAGPSAKKAPAQKAFERATKDD